MKLDVMLWTSGARINSVHKNEIIDDINHKN